MEIVAPTIAFAHEKIIQNICENGVFRKTEDNELTFELPIPSILIINNPMATPRISKYSALTEQFMKEYSRQLMHGSDNEFDYTYHERLFEYKDICYQCSTLIENNQINYIINKLKSEPLSRRAIAIIGNPFTDQQMKNMPCLQLLQCQINEKNELDMRVVFRSNDMLDAAGHNMYALTDLQNHIATILDKKVGKYVHISLNPHIYYVRDSGDLFKFVKGGDYLNTIRPAIKTHFKECGY